jgi:pimeloyl-ACP methyl ester carboxylesterase
LRFTLIRHLLRSSRSSSTPVKAPGPLLLMLEGRAPWELAATLAAAPLLRRAPRGDGHPVMVFPGLAVSDFTTLPLRHFLRERGYAAYPWEQGFNLGPRDGVVEACRARVRALADRHGERVSLVGWSLGGVYARELAKELPDCVRSVVTLGSPFSGPPHATNAWRLFELLSGKSAHHEAARAELHRAPPVPTTSVYSRTDGVVAWQCSLNEEHPLTENVEVPSSHLGMGLNPLALYVVADRLAQHPGAWKPFDPVPAVRWLFGQAPKATRTQV